MKNRIWSWIQAWILNISTLLVIDESEHVVVGVVQDPSAVGEVGVVFRRRGGGGEVGSDQNSL